MTEPSRSILGVVHGAVGFALPAGACDCHTHVFGPAGRFPLWDGRAYTPPDASIGDLVALHGQLGIERVVIVHPSPYGTDNAVTLDAIAVLGVRARGVAVIDEVTISDRELEVLHRGGMRGARLNLQTAGVSDPAVARRRLIATAERVGPFGWHVQTYTNLGVIAALAETIAALPVPLVVDHFGHADAARGLGQAGFPVLLELVRAGNTYVKLSGAYRVSQRADRGDVDDLARALVAAGPARCVWGSDWPHPGGGPHNPAERDVPEPFQRIDDGAALELLARWVPDAGRRAAILAATPARLYGFEAHA